MLLDETFRSLQYSLKINEKKTFFFFFFTEKNTSLMTTTRPVHLRSVKLRPNIFAAAVSVGSIVKGSEVWV